MPSKVTIGELAIMLKNHVENSSKFYEDLRNDFNEFRKEVRDSLEEKASHAALEKLQETVAINKKETDEKVYSLGVKMGVGSGILYGLSWLLHYLK